MVTPSLTVAGNGQVTLKRNLLQHLGIKPDERVELEKPPGGEIFVSFDKQAVTLLSGQGANARLL